MIRRDEIRAQAAVQAFDHRQPLVEYGFIEGTGRDIQAARELVSDVVREIDAKFDNVVRGYEDRGENPYKPSVIINGRDHKFVIDVPLFDAGDLSQRIERCFASSENARARPTSPKLSIKIVEGVTAMAREAGFEVAAIEIQSDGTPSRLAIRDSEYAAEAAKRQVVNDIVSVGAALTNVTTDGVASPDALGFTKIASVDDLKKARALVDELIAEGKARVVDHIDAVRSSGMSPFGQEPISFRKEYALYINKAHKPSFMSENVRIKRPICIEALQGGELRNRIQQLLGDASGVDLNKFAKYVAKTFAERMATVPGLPLASVYTEDSYYSHGPTIVVLTDPTVEPTLLQRLTGKKAVPALPAPAVVEVDIGRPATEGPFALSSAK